MFVGCCRSTALYTTKLQDRIIMLEMKVRCAELLAAGEDAKLAQLGPKQIAALRFASDQELGALLDRAVREQLAPGTSRRPSRAGARTTTAPNPRHCVDPSARRP